jgi:hypothetical protein
MSDLQLAMIARNDPTPVKLFLNKEPFIQKCRLE